MKRSNALLQLHTAVLLFGVAGLFGKLLAMTPAAIVAGRTLFAAVALFGALKVSRVSLAVESTKDRLLLALAGVILAVHWVTFFHAIQISSVAVGLIGYSTFPVFVTLMEPRLFRERLRPVDVLSGVVVLVGLVVVVPGFDLSSTVAVGLGWAVVSGFTFAGVTLMNRKLVRTKPSLVVTFYQYAAATVCVLPMAGVSSLSIGPQELGLLVLLGVVCTALPHTLFIASLVSIKAQLASVTAGLEPVYGILLAALLLGEISTASTIVGGTIVLVAVLLAMKAHQES